MNRRDQPGTGMGIPRRTSLERDAFGELQSVEAIDEKVCGSIL
jgi:hypothetical protein